MILYLGHETAHYVQQQFSEKKNVNSYLELERASSRQVI